MGRFIPRLAAGLRFLGGACLFSFLFHLSRIDTPFAMFCYRSTVRRLCYYVCITGDGKMMEDKISGTGAALCSSLAVLVR